MDEPRRQLTEEFGCGALIVAVGVPFFAYAGFIVIAMVPTLLPFGVLLVDHRQLKIVAYATVGFVAYMVVLRFVAEVIVRRRHATGSTRAIAEFDAEREGRLKRRP